MFLDHSGIRQDINYLKIGVKYPNIWKLNNIFLFYRTLDKNEVSR